MKTMQQLAAERIEMLRPEVLDLIRRAEPITLAEYREFRGNSWEHEAIVPRLDDEALAFALEHCAGNIFTSRRRPAVTYDEAIVSVFVPEILARLRRVKP